MTRGRRTANGLVLSLMGLIANMLSLQLFEGFNYLFGSIPVFIALRTLGIRWAFVVAVVGSSWVNVLFWHPTAMLWLSLEPVFVGLMMRRTRITNMVVWDAVYWPLVGNVILWIFFRYIMDVPLVGTLGAMLMFWLIGTHNALIAELLLIFLPVKRWMGMADARKTVSLKRLLFAVSTTLVWGPVFIIMAFNGQRISQEGKNSIRTDLERVSAAAARGLAGADPSALTGSDLKARLGWLDYGGVPYRFTLVDEEGRMIASTKSDLVPGRSYDPAGTGFRMPVTETIDRVIPRLPVKVPRWRLAQLSFFTKRVELSGGLVLLVEIPFSPFQSRVLRQQLDALLVLMAVDIVILLFSAFFAGALSRAIIRLGETTRDLPEKIDRQERARWPDTTIEEVALLAENFKETARVLREKFREVREANALLESRVRDRTAELERANRELTEEMDHRRRLEKEQAKLEEKLRQVERMESLGRLAGGVAHDFNNLLTPILGYTELLKSSPGFDAWTRKSLDAIESAAERASALTRQILAFSRKQVLEFEPVDLNATIRDFSGILKRIIGEDIVLDLHLCEEAVRVVADAGQLNQVLMNLAVNARDAMPSGGRLIMETRRVEVEGDHTAPVEELKAGPHVLMAVSDTGCGIDSETLLHIFEPFFTTKELSKGTGLGLATVYGIVKQHAGTIHVYSEIGSGTVFRIYLPLTPKRRRPKQARPRVDRLSGNERILVVEDEEMVRDTVCATLKKNGYGVVTAESAEAGLALLQETPDAFDLLLTDIVLPGKNGLELWQAAHELASGLKVLFMSGYTADVLTDQPLMDEQVSIIQKPFSAGELLSRLRSVFSE